RDVARGLMQITEETFDWIKTKIAPDETMTFEDLDTPEVNIRFGSYLLSACLLRYAGDVKTAAAAYHSGMGTVDALLKSGDYSADGTVLTAFPYRQMSNYVNKVSRSYEKYQTLYGA
ncbi:MAG: lytic transglycosylase domain-containing protein, partial [Ruthenibacterium sp.]